MQTFMFLNAAEDEFLKQILARFVADAYLA